MIKSMFNPHGLILFPRQNGHFLWRRPIQRQETHQHAGSRHERRSRFAAASPHKIYVRLEKPSGPLLLENISVKYLYIYTYIYI